MTDSSGNEKNVSGRTRVMVIAGPTASGKSGLGIEAAKRLNGEIINCDSMQIYKHMDIGTGKPTREEMSGIPHHLMSFLEPSETFSVAQYKELAEQTIDGIARRGAVPVIVGGTGLYVNSLVYNIEFTEVGGSEQVREKLRQKAIDGGNLALYNELKDVDPAAAERLEPNNVKRVIRALEIFYTTGESILVHEERSRLHAPKYDYTVFVLQMPREALYARIDSRVDSMIEHGLVDEVRAVLDMRLDDSSTASKAIAYKEMADYIQGKASLSEAAELLKRKTRNYAKRQITWFKKLCNVNVIDAYNRDAAQMCKDILDVWNG